MSMILDALKRSRDGQQSSGGVPTVEAEHYTPPAAVSRNPRRALVLLSIPLLLLAAGGSGYWLSQKPSAYDATPAVDPVPERSLNAVAVQPVETGSQQSNPAPPPPTVVATTDTYTPSAPDNAAVAALYNGAQENKVDDNLFEDTEAGSDAANPVGGSRAAIVTADDQVAGVPPAEAEDGASAAPVTDDNRSELPADSVGFAEDSAAPEPEQSMDIADLLEKAQRELGKSALEPHPAPMLEDLSQQTKNAIPSIMYQRHDWSGLGSTSSVILNGTALNEGQRVGAITVREILSDSVILAWRETEFRLRALNSWVNL